MAKRIAIVGWNTGANSWGATMMYVDFFSQFGIVEIIMHNETEVREGIDLLVLPGGPDVDPMRYLDQDDDFSLWNGKPCVFKERFDKVLLPQYIDARIPIFGICRGHQSLAVHFGGKLIQDMTEQGFGHESNGEDRTKKPHAVKLIRDIAETIEGLSTNYKVGFGVNSIHHQCIDSDNLPTIGRPLAVYTDAKGTIDGPIEAMSYLPDYPAFSVQWHPEDIRDLFSYELITNLLTVKHE
jgi:gamma-glutamyl-gamma-aminobutyrate hydrolase PuuD